MGQLNRDFMQPFAVREHVQDSRRMTSATPLPRSPVRNFRTRVAAPSVSVNLSLLLRVLEKAAARTSIDGDALETLPTFRLSAEESGIKQEKPLPL